MPNLFNLIKPRGEKESLQRNNFDLSNNHAYSQKAGVIDVIKCVHTVPKDYFDIDISDSTQTTAMNSAAFLKARKEISAYYVPYNYLWSNFNQYQATREDPKSAVLQSQGIANEPRIPLWVLYISAVEFFYGYIRREYYLKLKAISTLLSMSSPIVTAANIIGSHALEAEFQNEKDAFDILTSNGQFVYATGSNYQLDANTTENHTFATDQNTYNTDTYRNQFLDPLGCYRWNYFLRKLDMLGYGNLYPLFDNALRQIKQCYQDYEDDFVTNSGSSLNPDYFWNGTGATTDFNYVTLYVESMIPQLRNMCAGTSSYTSLGRCVSPYPLFAYNHVYYHMFRNSYYDLNYPVTCYNMDYLYAVNPVIDWTNLPYRFFDLAHHQFKKDMFTGVLPDVQFGVVSKVDISNVTILNSDSLTSLRNAVIAPSGGVGSAPSNALFNDGNSAFYYWNIPSAFDVLALKRAEMLQVYHQNLMRAGNRTSDIFKAIYGSNPKSELHSTPYFVEVLGEDMNLDPVVATADTGQGDNGTLGDIAARGLFGGSRSFKFSTEDFGCLMILGYVVPEPFYNSTRIDPHLMNLTPEDHLIPELMNLGFSPVLQEWLCNFVSSNTQLNTVRGYAPPYLEFKTDINLAHGAFASARMYQSFYNSSNYNLADYRGSLSHWVTTRNDMQQVKYTNLRTFYIHPSVLDSIFKVANDDTYETDQFICLTKINIAAVRQFSKLGLPSF